MIAFIAFVALTFVIDWYISRWAKRQLKPVPIARPVQAPSTQAILDRPLSMDYAHNRRPLPSWEGQMAAPAGKGRKTPYTQEELDVYERLMKRGMFRPAIRSDGSHIAPVRGVTPDRRARAIAAFEGKKYRKPRAKKTAKKAK